MSASFGQLVLYRGLSNQASSKPLANQIDTLSYSSADHSFASSCFRLCARLQPPLARYLNQF